MDGWLTDPSEALEDPDGDEGGEADHGEDGREGRAHGVHQGGHQEDNLATVQLGQPAAGNLDGDGRMIICL